MIHFRTLDAAAFGSGFRRRPMSWSRAWGWVALAVLGMAASAPGANPSNGLRIEIMAAYNLVVDSNVESPSTYGPKSAYMGAKFCNDGLTVVSNVTAYIGDFAANTPGIYPSRAHLLLDGPLPDNEFALTHEGGAAGTADAVRFLGTLAPGQCKMVYWLISYPQTDDLGNSVAGPSIKPDDDLWLEYDIWAVGQRSGASIAADDSRVVTMRNEISAMANKIQPNTANKVPQEYLDLLQLYAPTWTNVASDGTPGSVITSEGYWYDLGNIGEGFDNDGDLLPDRNAWMQPIGDPSLFDPSCFRLVRTHAFVVVKLKSGGELVLIGEDQLYFQNVPPNTGAIGFVGYEFQVMRGGCSALMTPYQEVASGRDNEKFNGDFGSTLGGGLTSSESNVALDKTVDLAVAAPGAILTYTIAFTNAGIIAVGDPDVGVPLVVQDRVPTGTTYVAGSAVAANTLPAGVTSYDIRYSVNHGTTWTPTEPVPATAVTDLQWWLSDAMPTGTAGIVRFQVTIANPFPAGPPSVTNIAGLGFGTGVPFLQDDAQTLIKGNNTVSGTVFVDDGSGGGIYGNGVQDGSEAGISNITVTLYYDVNGDGLAGTGDILYATTNSAVTSGDYGFTALPDGNYVLVVNNTDPDLPVGHTPTSPITIAVNLDAAGIVPDPVAVVDQDFGFAPVLSLTKTGPAVVYEGSLASYSIMVTNRFAGNGQAAGESVAYTVFSSNRVAALSGSGQSAFANDVNVYNPTNFDNQFGTTIFNSASKLLGVNGYRLAAQSSAITNVLLQVRFLRDGNFRTDDQLTVRVYTNNTTTAAFATTFMANTLSAGTNTVSFNITTNVLWSWALFGGTNIHVQFQTAKGGAVTQNGTLGMDQAALLVQTDAFLGTATSNNTLNPVPLRDYYDADILEFVCASPAVTTADLNGPVPNEGRLLWDNVGPLYAGGATNITVTYRVKEPAGNISVVTTNTALVTEATFLNGVPANSATSSVPSTVLVTGSIGDFVWRDLNANGVQDGGSETGIAGVKVVLTPPATVNLGNGPGGAVTNVTDASGFYLFTGLPTNGNYTVSVTTSTLPGGAGTATYDEDSGIVSPNNQTVVTLNVLATDGTDNHLTADFGYQNLQSQITGTIWNDVNRDGDATPDVGEPYMTNITVRLYDSSDVLVATATATNGVFNFFGAFNGTYSVRVDTGTGELSSGTWTQSYDSDGLGSLDRADFTVPLGGLASVHYSYYQAGAYTIGDTVFYDWDGDGSQDVIDEGITNVTVSLYLDINTNGVYDVGVDPLVGSQTTDVNGQYLFSSLASNRYFVVVNPLSDGLPPSYSITADPQGALDGISLVLITDASSLIQDFGYQPTGTGSIGDTVWRDRNADGLQVGPLETGITNVTVSLQVDWNGDGTYVTLATALTDANGNYLFSNLPDGAYRVVVDTADSDLPIDSFGNVWYPTTAATQNVTIVGGSSHLTADFGFAALGAIGDTIFWDANENGTQDYAEGGITNITVKLYVDVDNDGVFSAGDVLQASVVTDADGKYLFSGLSPANYVVVVDTTGDLSGVPLSADPEADGLPCSDPLATGCDGETGVSLLPGQSFMGADFGYVPAGGVIGDALWIDFNDDGVFDPGESGIPFITVELYDNANNLVATTETDTDGFYLFYGLTNGTYRVVVDTGDAEFPAGLTQTYDADGVIDNEAQQIVISAGTVISIGGVACTGCDLAVDFGYRYVGTNVLSGTIGLDDPLSIDGVLGAGTSGVGANEVAFENVTVYAYLWDDDGDSIVEPGEYVLINSTLTDAMGDYSFTNLPAGGVGDLYLVSMSAPIAGLSLTTTLGDTPATVLVDTTNLLGFTTSAYQAMPVAPLIQNVDFAFESGLDYDFGDLPDSYDTQFPTGARHVVPAVPDLYLGAAVDIENNGQPSVGADADDLDGVPDDEDGVVVTGLWQNGVDGGTVEVTVGGGSGWLVGFIDMNQDGSFVGPGEMVVSAAVASTGGPGSDGLYPIAFNLPDGTLSTTNTTQLYSRFRLFPSEPLFPAFSYFGEADNGEVEDNRWAFNIIRGSVYLDSDTDSEFSVGDTVVPGVVVELYDGNNNLVATTVTDLAGNYGFNGLPDDDYRIEMMTPTGAAAIRDVDGGGNGNATIERTLAGTSAFDQDYLVNTGTSLATLSGTVFEDDGFGVDGDGFFNVGDDVVPSVVVTLYRDLNGDGVTDPGEFIGSTTTDALGDYSFADLPDGDYLVVMSPPTGASSITDVDGNVNGSALIEVTLTGTDVPGLDFLVDGTATLGSLGDRVWLDEDADGIQDAGEAGIANVLVKLYDATGINLLAITVTDSEGGYRFPDLAPAAYVVKVDTTSMPAGLAANPTYDLDGIGTLHEAALTLATGDSRSDVDFGYTWAAPTDVLDGTGTGAIGDRVWIDTDGDGRQDPGEAGLGGITVDLYYDSDTNGTYNALYATTTTAADGSYIFDGLPAGIYSVVVNGGGAPVGYSQTGDPDGTLDNKTTAPIVLAPGDVYVNADFGYQPAASSSLSGIVYLDADANESLDGVDRGIAGVTVALVDNNGVILATTLTAVNGSYTFTGLPAGDYTVWVNDTAGLLGKLSQTEDQDVTKDDRTTVTLDGVASVTDIDFGYSPIDHMAGDGLIGDTIFLDRDVDGNADAGEGLQGVSVELYDSLGTSLLAVTTTDANGNYYFSGLAAGTYVVSVDVTTLPGPAGQLVNTVDPDGGTANTSTVVIGAGEANLLQDFGYRKLSALNVISGTPWEDRDSDGALEGAETARFAAVTVVLRDEDGNVVATTTTDASGYYVFSGLPDGSYTVDVTDAANVLNGYWHSSGTVGVAGQSQSDPYTLTVSGGNSYTVDYGYYVDGAALGNRVWHDANTNGQQDGGEAGMANVTVRLAMIYPNGVTNVMATVTDGSGYYSFANLLLDENHNGGVGSPIFKLTVVNPLGGYNHTLHDKLGVADSLDSDYPIGLVATTVKGLDNVSGNADPTLEANVAWYDFGFTLSPTLAVISAVRAHTTNGVAVISWEVSLELDTVGYYLERWNGAAWVRVNAALIPALLFESGLKIYSQADPGAPLGTTQSYRIVEFENSGALLDYGPYVLALDGGEISYATWAALIDWGTADSGPDGDADGDGLDNFQEYLAGTDPLSTDSVLSVNRIEPVGGGVQVSWSSATGRVYAVQMSLSLQHPFVAIATNILADPPENRYVVPVSPRVVPGAYFRVVVSQP